MLVSQDRPRIEIYRRAQDDWIHETAGQGRFYLGCLDLEVSLEAVYQDVLAEIDIPC